MNLLEEKFKHKSNKTHNEELVLKKMPNQISLENMAKNNILIENRAIHTKIQNFEKNNYLKT